MLTKAHRAAVSIMAEGCIVALVLPLWCFLVLLPNYTNILVFFFLFAQCIDKPEVFLLNTPKQQYFMLLTSGG